MVTKVKRKSNGSVERLRSKVVAGGTVQIFGENYLNTYAPVVSFSLIYIFLYISLMQNMFWTQLDAKTAFLIEFLEKVIWVMSPKGIDTHPSRSHRLNRAIYGLKQAHLAWHKQLCEDSQELGFKELPSAACLFWLNHCPFGREVLFLIYVDDMIVLSSTKNGVQFLTESFQR